MSNNGHWCTNTTTPLNTALMGKCSVKFGPSKYTPLETKQCTPNLLVLLSRHEDWYQH